MPLLFNLTADHSESAIAAARCR
eukprot:COSAG02_NODE_3190_length_7200_cov_5.803408_7_plen_22_part_01